MADLQSRREPLVIYQGDDEPISWTLTTTSGGTPATLDGYTARAQVRERPEPTAALLQEWSTEAGTAELSTQDATVELKVTGSAAWTWRAGFYDVHVTDFAGRTAVVRRGPVVVIPGVTSG